MLKCTSLVLRWCTLSMYFGRYENTRDIPEATATMAAIIAHTGPDLRIKSHGVFTGSFSDCRTQSNSFGMKRWQKNPLICGNWRASLTLSLTWSCLLPRMNFLSLWLIKGCVFGESVTNKSHVATHINVKPPTQWIWRLLSNLCFYQFM